MRLEIILYITNWDTCKGPDLNDRVKDWWYLYLYMKHTIEMTFIA